MNARKVLFFLGLIIALQIGGVLPVRERLKHFLKDVGEKASGYMDEAEGRYKKVKEKSKAASEMVEELIEPLIPDSAEALKKHPVNSEYFRQFLAEALVQGKTPLFDLKRWKVLDPVKAGKKIQPKTPEKIKELAEVKKFVSTILTIFAEVGPDGELVIEHIYMLAIGGALTTAQLASAYARIVGKLPKELDSLDDAKHNAGIALKLNNKEIRDCTTTIALYAKDGLFMFGKMVATKKDSNYFKVEQSIRDLMPPEDIKQLVELETAIKLMKFSKAESKNFKEHLGKIDLDLLVEFMDTMVEDTPHGLMKVKSITEYKASPLVSDEPIDQLFTYIYAGDMRRKSATDPVKITRTGMADRILLLYLHLIFEMDSYFLRGYMETVGDNFDLENMRKTILPFLLQRFANLQADLVGPLMKYIKEVHLYPNPTIGSGGKAKATEMAELCEKEIVPSEDDFKKYKADKKKRLEDYKKKLKDAEAEVKNYFKKYAIRADSMTKMYSFTRSGYADPVTNRFDLVFPMLKEGEELKEVPQKKEETRTSSSFYFSFSTLSSADSYAYGHLALFVKNGKIPTAKYYETALITEIRHAYATYVPLKKTAANQRAVDPYEFLLNRRNSGFTSSAAAPAAGGKPAEQEEEKLISDQIHKALERVKYFEKKYEQFKNNKDAQMGATGSALTPEESRDYKKLVMNLQSASLSYTNILEKIPADGKINGQLIYQVSDSWDFHYPDKDTYRREFKYSPKSVSLWRDNLRLYSRETKLFLSQMYKETPREDKAAFDEAKPFDIKRKELLLLGIKLKTIAYHVEYMKAREKVVEASLQTDNTSFAKCEPEGVYTIDADELIKEYRNDKGDVLKGQRWPTVTEGRGW